jgi:hypothetical protein
MAFSCEHMVPIEDAQKLERELADALTALAMLGDRHERELAEAKQKEVMLINTIKNDRYLGRQEGLQMERELAEAQKEIVWWNNKWQVAVVMAAVAENQRAALAHALKSLCIAIISEEPRDITDLLKQSGAAIAAVEGGSHE